MAEPDTTRNSTQRQTGFSDPKDAMKGLAAAMQFRGWIPYKAEVIGLVANRVRLEQFSPEDFAAVLAGYQDRPSPEALTSRLRAELEAPPTANETGRPAGSLLAPYLWRLESLPKSYKEHLWEVVHDPEFCETWAAKHGVDAAMLAKGLRFMGNSGYRLACAMVYAWEIEGGIVTEEMLADVKKGEELVKEGVA
jgi:hypothetical protein